MYLSQSDNTFLRTHTASLKHDEVIVNFTIVREPTHWSDTLLSDIVLSGGVVLNNLETQNIKI